LGNNHIWLSLDGIKLSMRYFSGFKAIDQVHIVGSICLREFILEKIHVQFHEFLLVRGKVLLISFSTFIIFNSHVLFLFFISTSSIEAVLLHFAKSIEYGWSCLVLFVTCWSSLLFNSVDPSGSFIELHKRLTCRVFDTKCLGRFSYWDSVLLSQLYKEPSRFSWDWVIMFPFVNILHIQNWSFILIYNFSDAKFGLNDLKSKINFNNNTVYIAFQFVNVSKTKFNINWILNRIKP